MSRMVPHSLTLAPVRSPLPRRLALILAPLILFVVLLACSSPEAILGTELTAGEIATSFTLTNQFAQPVSLTDYRGKVVVLTFLYTNCPDICPVTTAKIRDAYDLLGDDAVEVAVVAVSVDPERDTVEEALAFSDRWRMTDRWDFLTGPRDDLEAIWTAYYIDPSLDSSSGGDDASAATPLARRTGGVGGLGQDIAERYLVTHSSPVYLIDREGIVRVLHTLPFESAALAQDVRALVD